MSATGVEWLTTKLNADGSISTPEDVSTPFQATVETVRMLNALGETSAPGISAALAFISAEPYLSTENLSRKIISNVGSGGDATSLLADLLAHQNTDGGFGELAGFASTPLDTAFALEALAVAGASDLSEALQAVDFLTQAQSLDGSFSLNSDNGVSVYITAIVAAALQRFFFSFDALSNTQAANSYLLAQQIPGGGWATDWETALALLAVIPNTTDASVFAPALSTLRNRQLANGSWGNDVFATALALRAIHLAETFSIPVETTDGTISGRIVDDVTGAPIDGASVALEPAAANVTTTTGDGRFALSGVAPGEHTVDVQAAGYGAASLAIVLLSGRSLDLGTIRVTRRADVGIVSGILTNAVTGQPIEGAQVELSGAGIHSSVTDDAGGYTIVTEPGAIQLSASAIGFDPVTASASVNAGERLIFSPALYPEGTTPPGVDVSVTGIVVDAESLEALGSVLISVPVTGQNTSTDADGRFLLSGPTPGTLELELSFPGYLTTRLNLLTHEGGALDLGTIYLPRAAALVTTSIIGRVLDADTGEPIEGAEVVVSNPNLRAVSAADGSYGFNEIDSLEFELTASIPGYLSSTVPFSLTQPTILFLDIVLQRASAAGISIITLTTDQRGYPALSSVAISGTLSNSGPVTKDVQLFVVVTDSAGQVVQRLLASGDSTAGETGPGTVQLPPGVDTNFGASWNTDRFAPGSHQIKVQALDEFTGQVLAERTVAIDILVTEQIEGVSAAARPRFANFGAIEQVEFTASLRNGSNVSVQTTLAFAFSDPVGNVLASGEHTIELNPEEIVRVISLDSFYFTFTESGEYPLTLEVIDGLAPASLQGDIISVAPATRIKPSHSVTPGTVLPDSDKRLRINIRIEGEEQ